jgi:hypothetical protein
LARAVTLLYSHSFVMYCHNVKVWDNFTKMYRIIRRFKINVLN